MARRFDSRVRRSRILAPDGRPRRRSCDRVYDARDPRGRRRGAARDQRPGDRALARRTLARRRVGAARPRGGRGVLRAARRTPSSELHFEPERFEERGDVGGGAGPARGARAPQRHRRQPHASGTSWRFRDGRAIEIRAFNDARRAALRRARGRRRLAADDGELFERELAVRGVGALERVVAREAGVAVGLAGGADRLVDAVEREVGERVAVELAARSPRRCGRGRPSPRVVDMSIP